MTCMMCGEEGKKTDITISLVNDDKTHGRSARVCLDCADLLWYFSLGLHRAEPRLEKNNQTTST